MSLHTVNALTPERRERTLAEVNRHVTGTKRSTQAVCRNGERTNPALEMAGMGTWEWHVTSGDMRWSPEAQRILGDVSGSKRSSFESFLECVHAEDRHRVSH